MCAVLPGANHSSKNQRIPKSKHVQLAVRALVRERLTKYKHFFAQHIVDLMQQRGWLTIDESDQKMFASALHSALPLSSWILPW